MKPISILLGALALGAAAKFTFLPCDSCCFFGGGDTNTITAITTGADVAPRGDYLEARNVTVFGGHCHLNSEYDSQGDAALVAWSFDAGRAHGVDLAGVRVVAAIGSPTNMAEEAPRTSELWIDAPSEAARNAAEAWLRDEHMARLGAIAGVHAAPIAFERNADTFAVYVDDMVALEGDALADRSCCSMQAQRGYEPLMADAGAVVGNAARCTFEGTPNVAGWIYEGANSVFVTTFGAAASTQSCCPSSRADCEPEADVN